MALSGCLSESLRLPYAAIRSYLAHGKQIDSSRLPPILGF
jgi:hypothetical protein